jgi:hypothetical protein
MRIAITAWSVSLLMAGCGAAGTASTPPPTSTPLETPVPRATPTLPPATVPPTATAAADGPYLGQPLPGTYPTRFARAIIRGDLHTPPVFTPDGREVYWSRQLPDIQTMRLVDGRWSGPEAATFSASMTDYRDPFIAPGGDRLYFLSKGILPGSRLPEKENIWYVERVGDGWGEPRPLAETVNALPTHWQVSVAADRDLYFTSGDKEPVGDIYVSRYVDGEYAAPVSLGVPVDTDQIETTPFIAPDGRYLLFARLANESSTPRLYVSYADGAGGWGEPALISAVSYGLCPVVSPDGKYLFFLSSPQGISWMSAQVLEDLEPK